MFGCWLVNQITNTEKCIHALIFLYYTVLMQTSVLAMRTESVFSSSKNKNESKFNNFKKQFFI